MLRSVLTVLISFAAFVFVCCREGKHTLMPEVNKADSAVVMYYNQPGNPRFYKYTKVYDMKRILPVTKDVNKRIIESRNECTTQGKIYFYRAKEEVYTVYFCRAKGCMTFSFIKTGEKYFTRMSDASKKLLDNLQAEAKEPTPVN